MSEWIPVSKELPKIPEGQYGISVLVACFDSVFDEVCGGTGKSGYEVTDAVFRENGEFQQLCHGYSPDSDWGPTSDPVTHWMYRPLPPVRERIWEVSVGMTVENEECEPGIVVKADDLHNIEVDYANGKGLYCLVKGCKGGHMESGGALFKRSTT